MVTTALAHTGKLAAQLATAESLTDVVAVRDKASALKDAYAKVHEAVENLNAFAELKIRAECRAGQLLLDGRRNRGGRPMKKTCDTVSQVFSGETYGQLGIERQQARRWQSMARIPEEVLNRHIATVKDSGKELTTRGVLLLARRFNPTKANRGSRRNGIASMPPQEVESLRSENSEVMTVSVETVALCGRQVIITDDRASLVLKCPSKPTASTFALALREAIPNKPIRIELHPRGNNAVREHGQ